MRRIKITVLTTFNGPAAAIVDYTGQTLIPGDMYTLPGGACGVITKIELIMDAHSTMTVDHTTP